MVVREFVNRVTFQVTGKRAAEQSSESVRRTLEAVGKAGQRSGFSVSRSFQQIGGAAVAASRSVSALARGIGTAGTTGGRNLTPLRQAINSIGEAALRARTSISAMAAAGYSGVGRAAGAGGAFMGRAGRAAGAVTGAVTSIPAIAAGFGAYTIKETADEVMNLDGRLRSVTKTDAERYQIEKDIYDVSQANRQSMQAMGDLYTKVARAAAPMGYTSAQSLRVTDIVSKALTAGGASTAEAQATILQLGQALQSGTLQGDELASLRENAGRLMNYMAEAMGVTIGDLKDMGAQGELTSEKVINAILASGGAIDAEFAQMPLTIGQAFQKLNNSFFYFNMILERNTGLYGDIAHGLDSIFTSIGNGAEALFTLIDGPQGASGEDAFTKIQQAYPILNALVNSVLPAIGAIGSGIYSAFSAIASVWEAWGGNTAVAALLTNVFNIIQNIWTIISPLAVFFGSTLAAGISVVLSLLVQVSEIIESISDFFANSFGGIVDALSSVSGVVGSIVSGTGSVYDTRTQSFTFNVNSPEEANAIGRGFPELSPTV